MHAAEHVPVLAELDREPVGGVGGRDRAEHVPQPGVVADQGHGTGPGRAARTGS